MTMFRDGPEFLEDAGDAIEGGLGRITAGWDGIVRQWLRMRRAVAGIALAFIEKIGTGRRDSDATAADPTAPSDQVTDPGLTGFLRALTRAAARIDHEAALRKGETE